MKTLAQVEPRIPITNLPMTINWPGSYDLVTNLVGNLGQDGISIYCNNVTLDLSVYTLTGSNSINAISCLFDPSTKHLAIRNGIIDNTGAFTNSWANFSF